MHARDLTRAVLEEARALGFHRVGVASAEPLRRYRAYQAWLEQGMHGEMAYLARPEHRVGRADVRVLLEGARSVVVAAMAHDSSTVPVERLRGVVARYARARDYHAVMKARLRDLADRVAALVGRPVASRPCVDTAPVLERELAERAGLGFVGKNTLLIAPGLGSYVLLGELILDVELEPTDGEGGGADEAAGRSRCGTCRACLDACPTGAFVGPHVLDARRCISYLTIEHRGPIPRELRAALGTRIFGCDVCQEVCPFNAAAPARTPPDPGLALSRRAAERAAPELVKLLGLGAAQMRQLVRGTPLRRAGREGLLRNVCVALGNAGEAAAVPALERALADRSPLVRGHAAWALGQLGATAAIEAALAREADAYVREEMAAALR